MQHWGDSYHGYHKIDRLGITKVGVAKPTCMLLNTTTSQEQIAVQEHMSISEGWRSKNKKYAFEENFSIDMTKIRAQAQT